MKMGQRFCSGTPRPWPRDNTTQALLCDRHVVYAQWYHLIIPMLERNPNISVVTKSEISNIKMQSTKVNIHSEYLLQISHIHLVSAVVCFSYLFDTSVLAEVSEEEMQKRNTSEKTIHFRAVLSGLLGGPKSPRAL